jgi:serine/threonine protein kinase
MAQTRKNKTGFLGEGVHGKTYRLSYNSRGNTFYKHVAAHKIDYINLYVTNNEGNVILQTNKEINDFMKYLHSKSDVIAKIFKNTFYYTGLTPKQDFEIEINTNKKIINLYGKNANKMLTVSPITGYNNLKILGMNVKFTSGKEIYVAFGTECRNKYEIDADKFLVEILESLVILQGANYQHNDIKLDNIVLCDNRYKLIDWGQAGPFDDLNFGEMMYTDPIKWYLKGAPIFVAKSLMHLSSGFKNSGYRSSELFGEIYNTINAEIDTVLNTVKDSKTLLKMYRKTFDIFMVGMTLIHAVYTYKLDEHKYIPLAKKLISIKNPIQSAEKALQTVKTYLKNYKLL